MLLMSRQNRAGAISALSIVLLALVVALSSVGTRASAIARLQNATATTTPTPTPCDDDPDVCASDATDAAFDAATDATDTAAAITSSAGTATATPTSTTGVGTPTVTRTPTLSPTSFTVVATPTPVPVQPTTIESTETPIVIPDDALTCFPNQPLVITGDGPPHAAFLVYFDQRVVSGGSVSPSGRFATTLIVGRERAGVYPVTVRVRGTTQVLREISCAVPDVTPTFVPRERDLP
jgi:hypothetical protein